LVSKRSVAEQQKGARLARFASLESVYDRLRVLTFNETTDGNDNRLALLEPKLGSDPFTFRLGGWGVALCINAVSDGDRCYVTATISVSDRL